VESTPEGSTARLEFFDADSRRVEREIDALDCNEAVSSIALVTALAIDPRLSIAAPTSEEKVASEEVDERPEAEIPEQSRVSVTPRPSTRPDARPRTSVDVGERGGEELERWDHGWSTAVGAGVGAVSDIAPGLTPNAVVFAALGSGRHLRARLTAGYADSRELDLGGSPARFRLGFGRTELCPLALFVDPVTLRPCAAFEFGMLHAEGLLSPRIAESKASLEPWTAGLAALRAEVGLGRVLALVLEGQFRVPFLRRTYIYEQPETMAFETPRFGGGMLLALEARFR
jgi:hypothetical protein